jgi:hypothetical protein
LSLFSPSVLSSAADLLVAPPDTTFDDPAQWGKLNLRGWEPTFYQEKIARELALKHRVSVVGPHGMGKTGLDAAVVFWFARTREAQGKDWKVVTTAGAWRQLQRYLWPEIHKWGKRLAQPFRQGELLQWELKLKHGQAFAVASDDPANIEGAHADEILYIIDEAKNVPPASWDAIEGALSSGNAYCLANSTPGKAEGRLFEIHSRRPGFEDWVTIHVTLADAIKAGRIKPEWAESRKRQWGENSPVYKNRVLGEFSTYDENGVIPLEWLEAANERWLDMLEMHGTARIFVPKTALRAVSADVASEEGMDKTIIAKLYGDAIAPLIELPRSDTMVTSGKVMEIIQNSLPPKSKRERPLAVIDAIGVGTGVVDRLREQGVKVDAYMGSGKALKRDETGEITFLNRRAESWWHLRDLLNPQFDHQIALPDDPELIGDLVAPKFDQTSTGHIKIEDKDDIIVRLGRSPDKADAVVMAYGARHSMQTNLTDALPIGASKQSTWRPR